MLKETGIRLYIRAIPSHLDLKAFLMLSEIDVEYVMHGE